MLRTQVRGWGVEFDRCVQVRWYPAVGGRPFFGSGYAVGPRLVLTAAHVLGNGVAEPDPGRVTVAPAPGLGRPVREVSATVIWYRKDTTADAALLAVDDADWAVPESLLEVVMRPPQRWGRMIGHRPHPVAVVGFPRMQKALDSAARSPRRLNGTLDPTNASMDGRWEISSTDPTRNPFLTEGVGTRWSGMSGAAVLADAPEGDLLCGITRHDAQADGGTILTATPAELLVTDPDFIAAVTRHNGTWPPILEPVEPARLLVPAARNRDLHSPATLLRADAEAVPFHGRETETADLLRWCRTPPTALSIRVVTGAGGEGKSRLARHLVSLLDREGWVTGHIRHNIAEDTPAADFRAFDTKAPVLLVFDYAETRPMLLRRLIAHLNISRHRVRLLLLARDDGSWRSDAGGATSAVHSCLQVAQVMPLAPLHACRTNADSPVPDPATRTTTGPETADVDAALRRAARDLARLLANVPGMPPCDWTAVADTVDSSGLGAADRGTTNALTLQMTALTELLQRGPAPVHTTGDDPVEQVLLDHEQRYWHSSADTPAFRLDLPTPALADAVAAAALCGAADPAEAASVLAAVFEVPADKRPAVIRWLAQLYPAESGRYWGSLQPDRVAEYHASQALLRHRLPLAALLAAASPTQQAQLVTVVARAAVAHHNNQRPALGVRLLAALDTALNDAPLAPAALRIITPALPYPAANLAALAVRLATEQCAHDRDAAEQDPDVFEHELARSLADLSIRLSGVGRRGEAVTATEEAVVLYRRLASRDPGTFRAELATTLSNLGFWLADVGRWADALTVTEEAVPHFRELAAGNADQHEPMLARVLSNLGLRLAEMGRWDEAMAAEQEALQMRRLLAARDPAAFEIDLAISLQNLGNRLSEVGRWAEALAADEESLKIRRRLAAGNRAGFEHDLARSLTNFGIRLALLGRHDEALAAEEEADARYRALAESNPTAFEYEIARSLSLRGQYLGGLGQHVEALAHTEEAVQWLRRLSRGNVAALETEFARALSNHSVRLSDLKRWEEAITAEEEALEIWRRVGTSDRWAINLSTTLNNLSWYMTRVGRHAEGLAAVEEALQLLRAAAAHNPGAMEPELARTLVNRHVWLADLGRWDEVLATTQETLEIQRRLAEQDLATHGPALATTLVHLGRALSQTDRWDEAIAAEREANEVRRRATADGAAFDGEFARSLTRLGAYLSAAGRWNEAIAAEEAAVARNRAAAARDPAAFNDSLAASLGNLGISMAEDGEWDEAISATREAAGIWRRLAAADPTAYKPEFARTLLRLGAYFSEVGRWDEVIAAEEEAAALHRALGAEYPAAFDAGLVTALNLLAAGLSQRGRQTEAYAITKEAAEILHNQQPEDASPRRPRWPFRRNRRSRGA